MQSKNFEHCTTVALNSEELFTYFHFNRYCGVVSVLFLRLVYLKAELFFALKDISLFPLGCLPSVYTVLKLTELGSVYL